MAELIEFETDKDRLRAMDALFEAGETYSGIPRRRFLVSGAAVRLLRTEGVRFRILGRRGEEEPNASNP